MNSVSTLYQGVTLYNMHFLPTNGADYAYLGGIEPVAFYRPKIMCSVSGFSTKEIGKFKKDIRESGVLIDEESGSAQPSILFESFASYSNSSRGPRVRFRAQYDSFESHVGMSISYQDLNDPERWIVVKESMDEYVSSSERKSLPAGKPSDYSGGWAYDFPRREDVTLERKTIAYDVKLPYPTLVRVSINAESDSAKPHVFLLNARLQTEECVVDASYEDGRCL
ncbi:MAG: hypothetical protein NVV73_07215 [Cellvibrionaceae bacterium]|nr:hypothetical protein [Cellvibrionaceae bacterium]